MITIILQARTAQGFGGQEFYTETVTIENTVDAVKSAKRSFALKYGVEIDSISVKEGK